jgi:adenylate cyclase
LLARFRREAQTASSLNHPHICTVHALGDHDGRPFIVLEFIEGQTLKKLASPRLEHRELIRVMRQVAGALAAAHAAGVVHRDIKPENIMVRSDGYVKVLDFGLARRLPTLAAPGGEGSHDTWPGAILGTVAYMSPEQARGESLDGSSDIFSLGIVLYQLLAGLHPFDRGSPLETLRAIAGAEPLPPSRLNPAVPAALEGLIAAMLHKDARMRPSATEVEQALAAARSLRGVRPRPERQIVRRENELAALRTAFASAQSGRGHIVTIGGEPGIGKTTLVDDFLDELAGQGQCQIARGRCSERQASVAAYLPAIEALADLLRGESRESVARLVQLVAPTWHTQLTLSGEAHSIPAPAATTEPPRPAAAESIPARAFTQQAMLREFANLLTEISRLSPLVLFFDDVHWADLSTVDLLAYLGRHCQSLAVLIVATYRPTELMLGPHPLYHVKLELEGQGASTDLALSFLGRDQIDRYLDLALPDHALPPNFAELIHARTEGSPLFMVDLVRDLRERGVIAQAGGRWSLARELTDLSLEIPATVRSMIQRKFERLGDDDRRLLGAAAAQGYEFDSAVVAAALAADAADVEERLKQLERVHGLVRLLWEDEFPDRTLTQRYAFVHALYQQALFNDLSPTRRATLSKALARALERFQASDVTSAAAVLACLYEAGRDLAEAARYFHLAAQNAAQVFAHRDAVVLAQRGLDLLEAVPPSPDRDARERALQTTLGLQLQVTEGYAADSARRAYERARELCPATDAAARFPVLWGLWLVHKVRSELPYAQQLANELLEMARRLHDPSLALQAHQALGLTSLCRGDLAASLRHVEQVATLYHPQRHRAHSFLFGQDPGVICKAYGAVALWLLGYPDAAQRESELAIATSRDLSPTSQVVALHFAAMVYQLCRLPARARECAEASVAISTEHGFAFWRAGALVIGGWAVAFSESPAQGTEAALRSEGLARLRQGLADWEATGSVTYRTYYDVLLADALLAEARLADESSPGRARECRRVIDQSLALVQQTDEQMVAAELYRLRGELAMHEASSSGASSDADWQAAAADFRQALAIARSQEAKSLELRAATSLARWHKLSGQSSDEARQIVAQVCDSLTEGHGLADYVEARREAMPS